jgi:predicted ArsR family transcriptional regulator
MMKPVELREDLLAIMRIVKEKGGTDCSGSCHHRKPGELHCHALAQMLRISSSGVKERLLYLVRMGLMERHRIQREADTPIVRFLVSSEGEKALASGTDRLLKERGSSDGSSNA